MFSRTIFRSLLRSPPRSITRAAPYIRAPIIPASHPKKPASIRTYAQWPRPPRQPPRRRQWGKVSAEEHEEEMRNAKPLFTQAQFARFMRSTGLKVGIFVVIAGGSTFYYTNLEYVPVSGRRRFNCLSDDFVEEQGKMLYNSIMRDSQGALLPAWDKRTRQVRRVMERLIPACGMSNVDWEVHVIESQERNAFVIPGGKVFVYTGILPITKNDDGLAAVLGHEIAHNVASHQAESMSKMAWILPLQFLFYIADGTGYTMGLGRFVGDLLLEYGIKLPGSRRQESEADYIGLMIMAKSCYDPGEAVKVWERMEAADKGGNNDIPQWLSTHPSNANRITQMQKWLLEADRAREDSGCATSLDQSRAFQGAIGSWAGGRWT